MADEHRPEPQPLGTRRAHVVLRQHLDHCRAGDARDQGRVGDAERQRRQREVEQERPQPVRGRAVALHRQPAEPDREQEDRQIAQHKDRQGKPDDRKAHRQPVGQPSRPPCGHDTQRQRHRQRRDHRENRQRRRGKGALGDEVEHGPPEEQRLPEIAPQHTARPLAEPHEEGPVEPQRRAHLRDLLGARRLARQYQRRVAGTQGQQREDHDAHHRHDGQRGGNAAEAVGEHKALQVVVG